MRVLITGGLGFIGSNLALKCMSLGWEVVIVDNGKTENHVLRKNMLHKAGNVSVHNQAMKSFVITSKFDNFDVVFHLAALPSVQYSVERPYASFANNVQDTTMMMIGELASSSRIGRIVFASSAAVYGNVDRVPVQEDDPKNPESPYGLQKLICEQLLKLLATKSNVDTVSLRYFNAYGPYQLSKGSYATAISSWLSNIKSGDPLRKDGTGEQSRDMVFVEDIVDANILAATYNGKLNGISMNIASGTEISNNAILSMLSKKFEFQITEAPFREGDIMRTLASIERAKSVLGYVPKVSFEEGLEKTILSMHM